MHRYLIIWADASELNLLSVHLVNGMRCRVYLSGLSLTRCSRRTHWHSGPWHTSSCCTRATLTLSSCETRRSPSHARSMPKSCVARPCVTSPHARISNSSPIETCKKTDACQRAEPSFAFLLCLLKDSPHGSATRPDRNPARAHGEHAAHGKAPSIVDHLAKRTHRNGQRTSNRHHERALKGVHP